LLNLKHDPNERKDTKMPKSIAAQLRQLEEKKNRALAAARRETARVEEAKKKLSEPLSKRFSGWTKNAIDAVLFSNLERLDDLSDSVTREELEALVTEYLQAKLDKAEKPMSENAADAPAAIPNTTAGGQTEAASATA
jgi:uncharacterized alpha-E superfamily protein